MATEKFMFKTALDFVSSYKQDNPQYAGIDNTTLFQQVVSEYPNVLANIEETASRSYVDKLTGASDRVLSDDQRSQSSFKFNTAKDFLDSYRADNPQYEGVGDSDLLSSVVNQYPEVTQQIKQFHDAGLVGPVSRNWIGRPLTREQISGLRGGNEYLSINDANLRGRAGFAEGFDLFDTSSIPFVGDVIKAIDAGRVVGTARKIANGQEDQVSDQDLLNLNLVLGEMDRKSNAAFWGQVGSVVKTSFVMMGEIGLTLGGIALMATGAGAAPGAAATGAGLAALGTSIKGILTKKGIKAAASEGTLILRKALYDRIKKWGLSHLGPTTMEALLKGKTTREAVEIATARGLTGEIVPSLAKTRAVAIASKAGAALADIAATGAVTAGIKAPIEMAAAAAATGEAQTATSNQRRLFNALTGKDESDAKSLAAGLGDMFIEYASEASGTYLMKSLNRGILKPISAGRLDMEAMGRGFRETLDNWAKRTAAGAAELPSTKFAKAVTSATTAKEAMDAAMAGAEKWKKIVGMGALASYVAARKGLNLDAALRYLSSVSYDGIVGEMAEERLGGFFKGLFGIQGDEASLRNAFDQMVPTAQQAAVELVSFATPLMLVTGGHLAANAMAPGGLDAMFRRMQISNDYAADALGEHRDRTVNEKDVRNVKELEYHLSEIAKAKEEYDKPENNGILRVANGIMESLLGVKYVPGVGLRADPDAYLAATMRLPIGEVMSRAKQDLETLHPQTTQAVLDRVGIEAGVSTLQQLGRWLRVNSYAGTDGIVPKEAIDKSKEVDALIPEIAANGMAQYDEYGNVYMKPVSTIMQEILAGEKMGASQEQKNRSASMRGTLEKLTPDVRQEMFLRGILSPVIPAAQAEKIREDADLAMRYYKSAPAGEGLVGAALTAIAASDSTILSDAERNIDTVRGLNDSDALLHRALLGGTLNPIERTQLMVQMGYPLNDSGYKLWEEHASLAANQLRRSMSSKLSVGDPVMMEGVPGVLKVASIEDGKVKLSLDGKLYDQEYKEEDVAKLTLKQIIFSPYRVVEGTKDEIERFFGKVASQQSGNGHETAAYTWDDIKAWPIRKKEDGSWIYRVGIGAMMSRDGQSMIISSLGYHVGEDTLEGFAKRMAIMEGLAAGKKLEDIDSEELPPELGKYYDAAFGSAEAKLAALTSKPRPSTADRDEMGLLKQIMALTAPGSRGRFELTGKTELHQSRGWSVDRSELPMAEAVDYIVNKLLPAETKKQFLKAVTDFFIKAVGTESALRAWERPTRKGAPIVKKQQKRAGKPPEKVVPATAQEPVVPGTVVEPPTVDELAEAEKEAAEDVDETPAEAEEPAEEAPEGAEEEVEELPAEAMEGEEEAEVVTEEEEEAPVKPTKKVEAAPVKSVEQAPAAKSEGEEEEVEEVPAEANIPELTPDELERADAGDNDAADHEPVPEDAEDENDRAEAEELAKISEGLSIQDALEIERDRATAPTLERLDEEVGRALEGVSEESLKKAQKRSSGVDDLLSSLGGKAAQDALKKNIDPASTSVTGNELNQGASFSVDRPYFYIYCAMQTLRKLLIAGHLAHLDMTGPAGPLGLLPRFLKAIDPSNGLTDKFNELLVSDRLGEIQKLVEAEIISQKGKESDEMNETLSQIREEEENETSEDPNTAEDADSGDSDAGEHYRDWIGKAALLSNTLIARFVYASYTLVTGDADKTVDRVARTIVAYYAMPGTQSFVESKDAYEEFLTRPDKDEPNAIKALRGAFIGLPYNEAAKAFKVISNIVNPKVLTLFTKKGSGSEVVLRPANRVNIAKSVITRIRTRLLDQINLRVKEHGLTKLLDGVDAARSTPGFNENDPFASDALLETLAELTGIPFSDLRGTGMSGQRRAQNHSAISRIYSRDVKGQMDLKTLSDKRAATGIESITYADVSQLLNDAFVSLPEKVKGDFKSNVEILAENSRARDAKRFWYDPAGKRHPSAMLWNQFMKEWIEHGGEIAWNKGGNTPEDVLYRFDQLVFISGYADKDAKQDVLDERLNLEQLNDLYFKLFYQTFKDEVPPKTFLVLVPTGDKLALIGVQAPMPSDSAFVEEYMRIRGMPEGEEQKMAARALFDATYNRLYGDIYTALRGSFEEWGNDLGESRKRESQLLTPMIRLLNIEGGIPRQLRVLVFEDPTGAFDGWAGWMPHLTPQLKTSLALFGAQKLHDLKMGAFGRLNGSPMVIKPNFTQFTREFAAQYLGKRADAAHGYGELYAAVEKYNAENPEAKIDLVVGSAAAKHYPAGEKFAIGAVTGDVLNMPSDKFGISTPSGAKVEMKRHKNVAFQMIATLAAHQGADYEMARRAIQAMVDMVKAQISDFDPKSIDVEKLLTSPGKENLRALIDKAAASEGFPYLVKQIVQERNSKLRKVVGLDAVGMELIEMPHGEESVVHQDDTGRWMEEKDTGRVTVRQAGKIAVVASNKRPLLTDYEEGELLTPEGRAAHPGKHKAFALISANVAQNRGIQKERFQELVGSRISGFEEKILKTMFGLRGTSDTIYFTSKEGEEWRKDLPSLVRSIARWQRDYGAALDMSLMTPLGWFEEPQDDGSNVASHELILVKNAEGKVIGARIPGSLVLFYRAPITGLKASVTFARIGETIPGGGNFIITHHAIQKRAGADNDYDMRHIFSFNYDKNGVLQNQPNPAVFHEKASMAQVQKWTAWNRMLGNMAALYAGSSMDMLRDFIDPDRLKASQDRWGGKKNIVETKAAMSLASVVDGIEDARNTKGAIGIAVTAVKAIGALLSHSEVTDELPAQLNPDDKNPIELEQRVPVESIPVRLQLCEDLLNMIVDGFKEAKRNRYLNLNIELASFFVYTVYHMKGIKDRETANAAVIKLAEFLNTSPLGKLLRDESKKSAGNTKYFEYMKELKVPLAGTSRMDWMWMAIGKKYPAKASIDLLRQVYDNSRKVSAMYTLLNLHRKQVLSQAKWDDLTRTMGETPMAQDPIFTPAQFMLDKMAELALPTLLVNSKSGNILKKFFGVDTKLAPVKRSLRQRVMVEQEFPRVVLQMAVSKRIAALNKGLELTPDGVETFVARTLNRLHTEDPNNQFGALVRRSGGTWRVDYDGDLADDIMQNLDAIHASFDKLSELEKYALAAYALNRWGAVINFFDGNFSGLISHKFMSQLTKDFSAEEQRWKNGEVPAEELAWVHVALLAVANEAESSRLYYPISEAEKTAQRPGYKENLSALTSFMAQKGLVAPKAAPVAPVAAEAAGRTITIRRADGVTANVTIDNGHVTAASHVVRGLAQSKTSEEKLREFMVRYKWEEIEGQPETAAVPVSIPGVKFVESTMAGYPSRTFANASLADVTIDFAFTPKGSGGSSGLTRVAAEKANKLYINVPITQTGFDVAMAGKIIADAIQLASLKNVVFTSNFKANIAGHELGKMKISQAEIDKLVTGALTTARVLLAAKMSGNMSFIRSGGQTGFDEAGIKAAVSLGIPAEVLAPKGWVYRPNNADVAGNEAGFKSRFAEASTSVTVSNVSADGVVALRFAGRVTDKAQKYFKDGTWDLAKALRESGYTKDAIASISNEPQESKDLRAIVAAAENKLLKLDIEEITAPQDLYVKGAVYSGREKRLKTNYYEDVSVNKGRGLYKEYAIRTPFPVPGQHGDFQDPNLAGWFRVREYKLGQTLRVERPTESETGQAVDRVIETEVPSIVTEPYVEIQEVQSELFQKNKGGFGKPIQMTSRLNPVLGGREEITEDNITAEELAFQQAVGNDPAAFGVPTDSRQIAFLNLMLKDQTWVPVFVNAITQWAKNQGFAKVRFPTGETAAKVEGHQVLADRLTALQEERRDAARGALPTGWVTAEQNGQWIVYDTEGEPQTAAPTREQAVREAIEFADRVFPTLTRRAVEQIDAEISEIKTQGIEKLAPIETFYERRIAAIVNRMGAKPVTDSNGNTWREVSTSLLGDYLKTLGTAAAITTAAMTPEAVAGTPTELVAPDTAIPGFLKAYAENPNLTINWDEVLKQAADQFQDGSMQRFLINNVLRHPAVQKLRSKNLGLRVVSELSEPKFKGFSGMYMPAFNENDPWIELSYNNIRKKVSETGVLSDTDKAWARVLSHEYMHDITYGLLEWDDSFNNAITRLRQLAIQESPGKEGLYGFKDNWEFLSELFGNISFRERLMSIDDPEAAEPPSSVWMSIWEKVAKALSKKTGHDRSVLHNALLETMNAIDRAVGDSYSLLGAASIPQAIQWAIGRQAGMQSGKTDSRNKYSSYRAKLIRQAWKPYITEMAEAQSSEEVVDVVERMKRDPKLSKNKLTRLLPINALDLVEVAYRTLESVATGAPEGFRIAEPTQANELVAQATEAAKMDDDGISPDVPVTPFTPAKQLEFNMSVAYYRTFLQAMNAWMRYGGTSMMHKVLYDTFNLMDAERNKELYNQAWFRRLFGLRESRELTAVKLENGRLVIDKSKKRGATKLTEEERDMVERFFWAITSIQQSGALDMEESKVWEHLKSVHIPYGHDVGAAKNMESVADVITAWKASSARTKLASMGLTEDLLDPFRHAEDSRAWYENQRNMVNQQLAWAFVGEEFLRHKANYAPLEFAATGFMDSATAALVTEFERRIRASSTNVADGLLTEAEIRVYKTGQKPGPATKAQEDLYVKLVGESLPENSTVAEANYLLKTALWNDQVKKAVEAKQAGTAFTFDPKAMATIRQLTNVMNTYRQKEWTRRALPSKYKNYEEAWTKAKLAPKTMNYLDLRRNYINDVYAAVIHKVILNQFAVAKGVDGAPLVVAIPSSDRVRDNVLHDETLLAAAKNLAEYLGVTLDQNADIEEQYMGMVNGHLKDFKEYETIESPYKSIAEFKAQKGASAKLLNQLLGVPKQIFLGQWDALAGLMRLVQWTKQLSVGWSFFFPVALMESVIAGTGLKGNILFRLKTAMKHMASIRQGLLNNDPSVMDLVYKLERAGVQLDIRAASDVPFGIVDRDLARWKDNIRLAHGDGAANFFEAAVTWMTGKKLSNIFFNDWFPSMKIWAAEDLLLRMKERNSTATEQEILRNVAPIINDAYGGQNWHRYVWATPKMMQALNMLLFAPNWTLSAWNIAGGGLLTSHILGNYMEPMNREFVFKTNWPAMIALVLIVAPNIVQAGIWAAAQAAGAGDPDDHPFTFQNEEGRKSYIDITPLARVLPGYTGDPTGRRRAYARFGKQAYEVLSGWLTEPIDQFLRKLSQPARLVLEELTGKSPGSDWQLEFSGKGWMGFFMTDSDGLDGFLNSRIGYVAQKFLPMSTVQTIKNPETFLFNYIVPTSKGASMGKTIGLMTSVLSAYANEETWDKVKMVPGFKAQLDSLAPALLNAAERNGYDTKKIVDSAKGAVLGKLYTKFWEALAAKDAEKMNDLGEKIVRVGGAVSGLKASMTNKGKSYGKEVTPEMESMMQEALAPKGVWRANEPAPEPEVPAEEPVKTKVAKVAPAPINRYGLRADGTPKGPGFFGPLPAKDGMVSTEISIGVEFDGKEVQIPTLVPGLTRDEIDYLLAGNKPTRAIVDKAIAHARARMDQGLSPFAGRGERFPLPKREKKPKAEVPVKTRKTTQNRLTPAWLKPPSY